MLNNVHLWHSVISKALIKMPLLLLETHGILPSGDKVWESLVCFTHTSMSPSTHHSACHTGDIK